VYAAALCCAALLLFLPACAVVLLRMLCLILCLLMPFLCLLALCVVLNPLIHAYTLCNWSLVLVYMPNGLVHLLAGLSIGLLVDSYAH
jgi:hypothetical protein